MITVITGPPCSGKSTYVQQRAQPGDVIIDFDQICRALGGSDHDQAEHLREITAAAWAAAVRRAVQLHHRHDTWIIDARPRPERLQDYRRNRASIVPLTASKDELHRRATAAGRPPGDHQRIDAFLTAARHRDPAPTVRTRW